MTVYTAVTYTPTAAVRSEGQGPRVVGVTVYTAVTYPPTGTGGGVYRCWNVRVEVTVYTAVTYTPTGTVQMEGYTGAGMSVLE